MTNFPPPGTRVALYARGASSGRPPGSAEEQLDRYRECAKVQSWEVAGAYFDGPCSDLTLIGRDGYFRMMAAADRHAFDLILTEDLDRLSRSPADLYSIAEDLERLGIQLCTVSHGPACLPSIRQRADQEMREVRDQARRARAHLAAANGDLCANDPGGTATVERILRGMGDAQ